jgi:hypothetical protein
MSRRRNGTRTVLLDFYFRATHWSDVFSIGSGLAQEQLFVLREDGQLIGPH